MNKNQEKFLRELNALFMKYNIDNVCANEQGEIVFESNGVTSLRFADWSDECFTKIATTQYSFDAADEVQR